MADFNAAYKIVMKNEGGYANNPLDRGGETWRGIARKIHPTWQGWNIVDSYKVKRNWISEMEKDAHLQILVETFYKNQFWDKLGLDLVNNQRIAEELFDTGVNMGTGVSAVFLQRSLNVTNKNGKDYPDLIIDGAVGQKTIGVLNAHSRQKDVLKALNCLQGAKYIAICEANTSQEAFFSGWLTRVF